MNIYHNNADGFDGLKTNRLVFVGKGPDKPTEVIPMTVVGKVPEKSNVSPEEAERAVDAAKKAGKKALGGLKGLQGLSSGPKGPGLTAEEEAAYQKASKFKNTVPTVRSNPRKRES